MQARQILLHKNGPALWPEHKNEAQVRELHATTPESIWEGTYQGNPTPPGGSVFKRDWWVGRNRYTHEDRSLVNLVIARWVSWDYGTTDVSTAGDYSVQFNAAFGSAPTPARTFIASWKVQPSLTVSS